MQIFLGLLVFYAAITFIMFVIGLIDALFPYSEELTITVGHIIFPGFIIGNFVGTGIKKLFRMKPKDLVLIIKRKLTGWQDVK